MPEARGVCPSSVRTEERPVMPICDVRRRREIRGAEEDLERGSLGRRRDEAQAWVEGDAVARVVIASLTKRDREPRADRVLNLRVGACVCVSQFDEIVRDVRVENCPGQIARRDWGIQVGAQRNRVEVLECSTGRYGD